MGLTHEIKKKATTSKGKMNLEQLAPFQFGEELYKKFDIRQANGDLVKDKRELLQLVNESIFRKCARTSKEKYEVLDLRDKLLKLIRYEVNNSNPQTSSTSADTQQQISSDILVGKVVFTFSKLFRFINY